MGVTFRTWGKIVPLAVIGALGFGIGWGAVDVLGQLLVEPGASGVAFWWAILSMTIEGAIGGALVGATLGYLESRKRAEERRPRVR